MERCRKCIYFDASDRDAVNSDKCHCDKRDIYVYPNEEACGDYEDKEK